MEEKKNIGTLFDNLAGTYDRFNHVLSFNIDKQWRRQAVHALVHADNVLDVAIGTGDLAIEMLRQGKACHVTGIDLSQGMMDIGKEKALKLGLADSIRFNHGSAFEMPYDSGSFDAVTCSYGVRNFSDLDRGLREMYRVLRPGGQLLIMEFSYPTNPVIRWGYNLFFSHIMPLVGRIMHKDKATFSYFRHSVKTFIWGQQMADRIAAAGFTHPTFRTQTFGISTIYTATK